MSQAILRMLVVVTCLGGMLLQGAAAEETSRQTVAIVNGKPISAEQIQLQFFLDSVPKEAGPETHQKLLNELIDRELIRQYLVTRKIVASSEKLDHQMSVVQTVIARQGEQLDDVLSRLHLTQASLRDVLALPLAWDTYVRSVTTSQQLQEFWNEHRNELDGTRVQAAQIVRILPQTATEAEWQAAEKLLADAKAEIESGTITFAVVAEKISESPSARRGGDLGTFEFRGRVDDAISRVAFSTPAGQISAPFRTRFGLHLVQVRKVIPGQLSLEDAREEIFSRLNKQLWDRQVQELRKQARIQMVETK